MTESAFSLTTPILSSLSTEDVKPILPANLIEVIHNPSNAKLDELKVSSWDTWEKEVSTFTSNKKRDEMFYVLNGEFTVTPDGGKAISFGPGDLATFRKGLKCTWDVTRSVKKAYKEL